jgi:hypothetical protein
MNRTSNSTGNSARYCKPLPTINFIIAVNSCPNIYDFDCDLLQGKEPKGVVWPGRVSYVLTPAEIETGLSRNDITIPPLHHVLLDRGYTDEQLARQRVAIILFQVYRPGLDSGFKQIWDWAFNEDLATCDISRERLPEKTDEIKFKRVAYSDMADFRCPVNAGDRGFLEVSSSILVLSDPSPFNTANLFCPELIHAGKPDITPGNSVDSLASNVA